MPAPLGNQYAKGNSGGRPYSYANREKAAKLKGLLLDFALEVMTSKKTTRATKMKLLLKLGSTLFPREHTGEYGEPIKIEIQWINGNQNNNNSLPTTSQPTDSPQPPSQI